MAPTTLRFLKLFALGYPAFILLDTVFLGYLMRRIYQSEIGAIARSSNGAMQLYIPAGLFVWALIVVGAIVLVLPRCQDGSLLQSFLWGAFYGLVLYGVYDLTNYAVLAQWTFVISIIDITWGMLANGILLVLLTWLNRVI